MRRTGTWLNTKVAQAAPPYPTRVESSVTGVIPDAVPLLVRADAERVTTTSLVVAERLGKQHRKVLRDIERLFAECEDEEYRRLNFEPTFHDIPEPTRMGPAVAVTG